MSDVYFSTNPADWEALEGLYISERKPPGFIRGQDISVVGFAGQCVRGPLTPQRILSASRFLEVYGGRDQVDGGPLKGEVWAALLNKPFGEIVVRRVAAAAAAEATVDLEDATTPVLTVDASSVGAWGNSLSVDVEDATDEDADHFNLIVKYRGGEVKYENLDISATDVDNTASVVGDDAGRWITLTKLANGRPDNIADEALTTGSDGSIAATDYESGLDDLAAEDDVHIVLIPEIPVTAATIATKISALAALAVDRIFLTWAMVLSETVANVVTDVATYTRSDRIVYCYNDAWITDPETGVEIQQAPHIWMASILANNDVNVHPGSQQTSKQTAGIKRLENTGFTRAELISLKNAGISTLELIKSKKLFRSGVTTDLTSGKTEIARRRSTDFLQLSAAADLAEHVKNELTTEEEIAIVGKLTAFSDRLKKMNRIIQDFAVITEGLNTDESRARGIFRLLWKVRLFGHILSLVVETEIGTGVTITEEAA